MHLNIRENNSSKNSLHSGVKHFSSQRYTNYTRILVIIIKANIICCYTFKINTPCIYHRVTNLPLKQYARICMLADSNSFHTNLIMNQQTSEIHCLNLVQILHRCYLDDRTIVFLTMKVPFWNGSRELEKRNSQFWAKANTLTRISEYPWRNLCKLAKRRIKTHIVCNLFILHREFIIRNNLRSAKIVILTLYEAKRKIIVIFKSCRKYQKVYKNCLIIW